MMASFSRLQRLPNPSRIVRRFFSSEPDYKFGTVKFYARHRSYGFVRPDGSDDDVFIHRKNIESPVPFSENPANPYLKKGERIRFVLDETDDRKRAFHVTYEDGTPLPMFREAYLERETEKIYHRFGQNVFDVLSMDGSEDEHFQQILYAYQQANDQIVRNQNRAKRSAATTQVALEPEVQEEEAQEDEEKTMRFEPDKQEEVAQEDEEEKAKLPKADLE